MPELLHVSTRARLSGSRQQVRGARIVGVLAAGSWTGRSWLGNPTRGAEWQAGSTPPASIPEGVVFRGGAPAGVAVVGVPDSRVDLRLDDWNVPSSAVSREQHRRRVHHQLDGSRR